MDLLRTHALDVSIAGQPVCRGLDLRIAPGERWCILGRNGAGKTTLLHTLAGLHAPDCGTITLAGVALAAQPRRTIARQLGVLFQDHHDAFPATVLETVLTGRHPWLGTLQWETADDLAVARAALAAVDLAGLDARSVNTLSGGERRRLGIATLLTQQPRLLLLDEPANHLDIHQQIRMLGLLRQQAAGGERALCLVMHDLNLAARYCDRFLLLFGDGTFLEGGRDTVLTAVNLERLYHHPLRRIEDDGGPVWIPA
jgi:iron complex transport system ATP-binding protein